MGVLGGVCSVGGLDQHMNGCETVHARDGEESTEGVEEATTVGIWAWPPRFGDEDDRDTVEGGRGCVNPFPRVVANRTAFPLRGKEVRPPSRIRSDELFVSHVRSDRGLLL